MWEWDILMAACCSLGEEAAAAAAGSFVVAAAVQAHLQESWALSSCKAQDGEQHCHSQGTAAAAAVVAEVGTGSCCGGAAACCIHGVHSRSQAGHGHTQAGPFHHQGKQKAKEAWRSSLLAACHHSGHGLHCLEQSWDRWLQGLHSLAVSPPHLC